MVGAGRDLCGSSSPTSLPKQGLLQQAAQDLDARISPGTEGHRPISTFLLLPPGLSRSLVHRTACPGLLGPLKPPVTGLPLK